MSPLRSIGKTEMAPLFYHLAFE